MVTCPCWDFWAGERKSCLKTFVPCLTPSQTLDAVGSLLNLLLFIRWVMSDSLWLQWTEECQASLSFAISWSLLRLMSIESMMLPKNLILCHPLLPSVFPNIRVFCSESALYIRWPKYWSFSFSINPSSEYSGLISVRIDWFDLFAVQGTLLFTWSNTKVSIFQLAPDSTILIALHSVTHTYWGLPVFLLTRVGIGAPVESETQVWLSWPVQS